MINLSEQEFAGLVDFVKVNYGINLSSRKTFVELRMQKLMQQNNFDNFTEYFNFVCSDITGVAISNFISSLTINYTLFYRESFHFDFLNKEVLPYLCEKERFTKDLRVWSAGCSTGEEPYTIAMIIADYLGFDRPNWDMKILATDISSFALKKGLNATYPVGSIECLNSSWVKNYFCSDPNDTENVVIAPTLKDEVVFRKLNLIGDSFNFKKKFHFIFCRNVMIYFDANVKARLVDKFYNILDDGGYLFIGMSETLDKSECKFKYIMPSVYRKEGGGS